MNEEEMKFTKNTKKHNKNIIKIIVVTVSTSTRRTVMVCSPQRRNTIITKANIICPFKATKKG